jgi:hypothetical protein
MNWFQIVMTFFFFIMGSATWSQVTITSIAQAEVIESIAATETESLNFGRFTPLTAGGSVVIAPNGSRTAQGSVALATSDFSPGKFTVTGSPNASFEVQLPSGQIILTHQTSNKLLIVEGWISDPTNQSGANILTDGSKIISIGATLNVGSLEDNPVGMYSGAFELTFAYN